MSQFADRKHVVTAIKFDGSDASALAIVKAFGSGVAMSAKDGAITLTLSRRRNVHPGQYVFRRGDLVTALTEDKFAERYVPIASAMLAQAIAVNFPPPSPADRLGEFVVGMSITEIGGNSEEMEILDIEDGVLICDSHWGVKTFTPDKVRLATGGGDGE